MSENNKKRSGSFRKFFPNLFRNKGKHKEARLKVINNETRSTQYLDPRIRSDKHEPSDTERIYENLTVTKHDVGKYRSLEISSNHSSSSTLVSDSVRNRSLDSDVTSDKYNVYAARPQVPPKPYPQASNMNPDVRKSQRADNTSQYPNVYYHPIEKHIEKRTPFNEIEMYKANQVQESPTSVGAEIKKVSTKFLISPKKEAEVRTIKPTRARSLSFDRENNRAKPPHGQTNLSKTFVKKSYNYSAPTSPVPTSHSIPNMPKTVSPYELLRKNISEAEQKKNTPSNRRDDTMQGFCQSSSSNATTMLKVNGSLDKGKTRQKVEAFYWQKLKEMKDKEDEFYMRQSISSCIGAIGSQELQYAGNSKCSTPIPTAVQLRSSSLPRGRDMLDMMNQPMYAAPFKRGTPERRTDTYLKSRAQFTDPEIIYRRTEKINSSMARQAHVTTPIFQRGSLIRKNSVASPPKRVSFDEHSSVESNYSVNRTTVGNGIYSSIIQSNERPANVHVLQQFRRPPQPPVRTTSVGVKNLKLANNKRINHIFGTESESGSEAGEIQRILQNLVHRVSAVQIDELLQHLMAHPSLARGVGLGARSRETIDREWNDLAARLNAHGEGATKTGKRWKRYWADLKFKCKNRAALRRIEASGTGGGPATLDLLSETEQKVLAIIGEGAVYGDTQHRVPAFPTDETQPTHIVLLYSANNAIWLLVPLCTVQRCS